jgi:hypothetical protein
MLIELGRLVRIEWTSPGRRGFEEWPMRSAPILAYETTMARGSLFIVCAPRRIGRASTTGVAHYAATHWGKLGRMQEVAGATLVGSLRPIGRCYRVIYATRKGSDEIIDFDHVFGTVEGGRKLARFTAPEVCTSNDRRVPRGTFQLAGGTYRVTTHGIVG